MYQVCGSLAYWGDVAGQDAGERGPGRLAAVRGPEQGGEHGRGLGECVRVGGGDRQHGARVRGLRGAPEAFLVGGQVEGGAVLGLAAVDVRVVSDDDDHGVGGRGRTGDGVLAALDDLDLEDGGGRSGARPGVSGSFFVHPGNLYAVGGDRDVPTRSDVHKAVPPA